MRTREFCYITLDQDGVLSAVQSWPFEGAQRVTEAEYQTLKQAREALLNARLAAEAANA